MRQASRMATISACAVGSLVAVTQLAPSAMTRPSFATRAAKGPPRPERTFSRASAMARRMNSADMFVFRESACLCRRKIATPERIDGVPSNFQHFPQDFTETFLGSLSFIPVEVLVEYSWDP